MKAKVDPADLIRAAQGYAADCAAKKRESAYMKYPAGFLRSGLWQNFLASPAADPEPAVTPGLIHWGPGHRFATEERYDAWLRGEEVPSGVS